MIRIEKCARRGFDAPASTISPFRLEWAYDGGDRVRLQWTDEWRIVG